jgi:hypothetical protein
VRRLCLAEYFFTFAAAAIVLSQAAAGEIIRGQSRELGVRFEVAGGDDWCRSNPNIKLEADKGEAFALVTVAFQEMIGRIRAVVMAQCSIVEELTFTGTTKGNVIFSAEISNQTRWRYLVTFDQATKRPDCLGGQPRRVDCGRHSLAYMAARQALNRTTFPDLELTVLLDPNSPAHLAWRSGDVSGKVTIAEGDPIADSYDSSSSLAAAFLASLMQDCKAADGAPGESWTLDGAKEVTLGGFQCQRPSGRDNTVVVAAATAAGFDIFSLWSDKADVEAIKMMGWGVALAVKDRGW